MRAIRVASHNTASTAGSPIMTDSEITVPALATALIEATSNGGPLVRKKATTNANCPANIAANSSNPHRLVPQNFQTRGGRCAPGYGAGVADAAELSGKLIDRLSIGAPIRATPAPAGRGYRRQRDRRRRTC